MTHLDRDALALVALAELELSAAEREHLADCPACTGELDALRRTVLIGRAAGSVDLIQPADAVWGRIHAALGLSDAVLAPPSLAESDVSESDASDVSDVSDAELHTESAPANPATAEATQAGPSRGKPAHAAPAHAAPAPAGPEHAVPAATKPTHAGPAHAAPAHAGPAQAGAPMVQPTRAELSGAESVAVDAPGSGGPANPTAGAPEGSGRTAHRGAPGAAADGKEPGPASVVDLNRRRRRRAWVPIAAAACAVGLVGGIAGGAWWQSTRVPAPETVIAQAQLDALPGWTASGSASIEETPDGRREVVVDLVGGAGADGMREVWLLTPDAKGLVSVGLLDGDTGRFSIPAGLDLAEYPVVDVSAEPADGNPAHSGDSIVRGTLNAL